MTSMTNLVAIDVETLKIDSRCPLEKEFIQLIPEWYYTLLSIKLILCGPLT